MNAKDILVKLLKKLNIKYSINHITQSIYIYTEDSISDLIFNSDGDLIAADNL